MKFSSFIKTGAAALSLVFALAAAPEAEAALIDFHGESAYNGGGGAGTGRGIGFLADEDFAISSFGIYHNLNNVSHSVKIYSSTNGTSVGALLNSASTTMGGGLGWYDMAISQSFSAGSYYYISWEGTAQDSGWAGSYSPGTYFFDSGLPYDVGVAKLIDGAIGNQTFGYSFGNLVHANFRVDTAPAAPEVPLPAGLPLLLTAMAGLGLARRRLG
ncbi:MAG: VPLPA-CTERM sorting domain-containing protein [Pseudooceanicola sp.]